MDRLRELNDDELEEVSGAGMGKCCIGHCSPRSGAGNSDPQPEDPVNPARGRASPQRLRGRLVPTPASAIGPHRL